ncbi:hypothetical protein PAXRUDRAFT_150569 [Paxillus rubicundulus Ve08.2h10]|uniref:Uncharacterized protein n=1 Tax=Paxillus rubicundulus Ve08.2h10 TaxID=930991 RepID=A0A0D0DIZ2_9AGAM|nr:hypothetical protein PAXRUDRAFT_150569 [Paxillus rubicundulus Ve08.2h10]
MQTVQLFGPPVFNISTGGMFPAAPTNITDIVSGAAAPAHVASDTPYPRGLSANYTILQQGFTVDVECRAQSLSDTGSGFPSMTLLNASLPLPPLSQSQPGSSSPLVSWAWTTNYVGSISVSNAGEYPAKVLAGAVCPFQDFDGPSNQSALVLVQSVNGSYSIGSSGSEMPSMVCEVTPYLTTIRVQYSGTTANVSDVVNKTRLDADGTNWPLLFGPARALAMIFYSSQGMTDNYIMNSMVFTMAKLTSSNVTIESLLESYLRGMVEYWGTMHRTLLYIEASLPDDMMIQTSGTMLISTMGWQYDASTHSFALVPITIVMCLTVCAVVIAYWEKRRVRTSSEEPIYVAHQSFDPSDPLHVILTSRSGGHYQASGALSDRHLPGYISGQVQLEVGKDGMAVLRSERCGKDETSGEIQPTSNTV